MLEIFPDSPECIVEEVVCTSYDDDDIVNDETYTSQQYLEENTDHTFSNSKNVSGSKQVNDVCEEYGQSLAKKLRAMSEEDRELVMNHIDDFLSSIKNNNTVSNGVEETIPPQADSSSLCSAILVPVTNLTFSSGKTYATISQAKAKSTIPLVAAKKVISPAKAKLTPVACSATSSSYDEDDDPLSGQKKRRRAGIHKPAIEIMRTWLFQNLDHPYPSDMEKRQLAAEANLSLNQVSNWFINARRRILQPMIDALVDSSSSHSEILGTQKNQKIFNGLITHCISSKNQTTESQTTTHRLQSCVNNQAAGYKKADTVVSPSGIREEVSMADDHSPAQPHELQSSEQVALRSIEKLLIFKKSRKS